MFAEQLKMGDVCAVKLDCDHDFTGGEMRCKKCNIEYKATAENMRIEASDVGSLRDLLGDKFFDGK